MLGLFGSWPLVHYCQPLWPSAYQLWDLWHLHHPLTILRLIIMTITMVVVVSLKWFHGTCQWVVGTWLDWFPRRSSCLFFPPPLLTDFDRIKSCPGMWKLSNFKFPDRNWFNQIIFTKVNFPSKFNNKFTLIGCQLFCWCKIMHSARLCIVQKYAQCKIMQSEKYAECKIMQSENYAECKIMQTAKLCRL